MAKKSEPGILKGWRQIAERLGQPVSVAQRWAKQSGTPLSRQGKFVIASAEELNRWLGRESAGEPIRITRATTDLGAELKRGLSYVRRQRTVNKKRRAA